MLVSFQWQHQTWISIFSSFYSGHMAAASLNSIHPLNSFSCMSKIVAHSWLEFAHSFTFGNNNKGEPRSHMVVLCIIRARKPLYFSLLLVVLKLFL